MITISPQSGRRIVNAVRTVEQQIAHQQSDFRDNGGTYFWAKITDYDDEVGEYSWIAQKDNSGTLVDDNRWSGEANATDVNGAADIAAGTIVLMEFSGYVAGQPTYRFIAPGSGGAGVTPGNYQYQVFQMVSDNQVGWDWLRSHPIT